MEIRARGFLRFRHFLAWRSVQILAGGRDLAGLPRGGVSKIATTGVISKAIDCATGNFQIGALLALDNEWQKVDQFRILMGCEVTPRTRNAFVHAFDQTKRHLDASIEAEKERNEF